MKNHGFKSVFEVCAALLAQYIAFYMVSSRLGKEAEIENFLTNKFVMIFWVIYLILGFFQVCCFKQKSHAKTVLSHKFRMTFRFAIDLSKFFEPLT